MPRGSTGTGRETLRSLLRWQLHQRGQGPEGSIETGTGHRCDDSCIRGDGGLKAALGLERVIAATGGELIAATMAASDGLNHQAIANDQQLLCSLTRRVKQLAGLIDA